MSFCGGDGSGSEADMVGRSTCGGTVYSQPIPPTCVGTGVIVGIVCASIFVMFGVALITYYLTKRRILRQNSEIANTFASHSVDLSHTK